MLNKKNCSPNLKINNLNIEQLRPCEERHFY